MHYTHVHRDSIYIHLKTVSCITHMYIETIYIYTLENNVMYYTHVHRDSIYIYT